MPNQHYCLRWKNHQPNFISVFSSLLNNETLVDVTLAADGKHLQAHKVVLSACSAYFQELFSVNPCQHPIVILKDISYNDLKAVVDFIYSGEINVAHDQLQSVLKTAETLSIKGLANMPIATLQAELQTEKRPFTDSHTSHRRKRLKKHSSESFGSGLGSSIEEIEVLGLGNLKTEDPLDVRRMPSFSNDSQNQLTPETLTATCTSDIKPETSHIKTEDGAGGISVITGIKKRFRLLTRQSHIVSKQDPDGDEGSDIDFPTSPKRPLGRQYSDPTPQQNITSDLTEKSSFLVVPTSHLIKQNSDSALPSQRESSESLLPDDDLKHGTVLQQPRSNHCPMLRPGPALGCNFCWNTIDNHGRILRRKTKYHCPECRTNLCIVPCFQDYHMRKEDLENENEHAKENQKDPLSDDSFPQSASQKIKTPSSSSL